MKIIVGLGNPGEKYENTRHNLGFLVLDQLVKDNESVEKSEWSEETKFKSEVFELSLKASDGEKILLMKPKTFMNNSGMAVSLVSSFYKVSGEDVWVVYDELDLPLGSMKIRFGGAAAGHHGVENIIEKLGTDKFWRFRLGIGQMQHHTRELREEGKGHAISKVRLSNAEDYVLGSFTGKDRTESRKLIKHASEALQVAIQKGMETAMNRFNTK